MSVTCSTFLLASTPLSQTQHTMHPFPLLAPDPHISSPPKQSIITPWFPASCLTPPRIPLGACTGLGFVLRTAGAVPTHLVYPNEKSSTQLHKHTVEGNRGRRVGFSSGASVLTLVQKNSRVTGERQEKREGERERGKERERE